MPSVRIERSIINCGCKFGIYGVAKLVGNLHLPRFLGSGQSLVAEGYKLDVQLLVDAWNTYGEVVLKSTSVADKYHRDKYVAVTFFGNWDFKSLYLVAEIHALNIKFFFAYLYGVECGNIVKRGTNLYLYLIANLCRRLRQRKVRRHRVRHLA